MMPFSIVMNVYYFMLSTCLISIKLFAAFWIGIKSNPGYVERAQQDGDSEKKN